MTIEEIYSQLNEHMVEGLMTHSQLADYFCFIGLDGYKTMHLYHYFEESNNHCKLNNYYLHHYNKLINEMSFKNPKIIPDNWHQYTRQDVDTATRKNAIQVGMTVWLQWEKDTKKLYESLYQELLELNEIAAAGELLNYIEDVNNEVAEACQLYLDLKAIDYNISDIMMEQKKIEKQYREKLKEIKLC